MGRDAAIPREDELLIGVTDIALALREASLDLSGSPTAADALNTTLKRLVDRQPISEEADKIRQELLEPIVYLVANYVPLSPASSEFGFQRTVAAVAKRGEFQAPLVGEHYGGGTYIFDGLECSLKFFDGADANGDGNADLERIVGDVWVNRWREYLRITELGQGSGLATWNQFLLTNVRRPRELGVSWDPQPKDQDAQYYIRVGPSTFRKLGLPPLGSTSLPAWKTQLWNLPSVKEFADHLSPDTGIRHLIEWSRRMRPKMEMTGGGAAWALFHLLRSYAIWGGRAFLSIPLAFGASETTQATCVLSLCTTRPLEARIILRWRLIGREIFHPLIARETENVIRHDALNRQHVHNTYAMGHALKHRAMPLSRELDTALGYARRDQPEQVKESLELTRQFSRGIRNFGILLHFLNQVYKAGPLGLEMVTKDATAVSVYRIGDELGTLLDRLRPSAGSRADALILATGNKKQLESLVLHPFIYNSKAHSLVRPIDEFYEEVLYEICVNAANYGLFNEGSRDRRVDIEFGVLPAAEIVISNGFVLAERGDRFPQISEDEWVEWPHEKSHGGGLLYSASALKSTGTGRMYLRWTKKGDHGRFHVKLQLKGVQFQQVESHGRI